MTQFLGQPLFKTASITKVGAKLSMSAEQWESQILDELHKQCPYLLTNKLVVRMKHTDEESGHGIGAIRVNDKITVPVIVKSNRLLPLDMFLDEKGRAHALSRASMESEVMTKDLGKTQKGGSGAKSDSTLSHMTQPPYDGKYAFASMLDGAAPDEALMRELDELPHNPYLADVIRELVRPVAKHASYLDAHVLPVIPDLPRIERGGVYKVATDHGFIDALVSDHVVSLHTGNTIPGMRGVLGLDKVGGYGQDQALYGIPAQATPTPASGGRGVFVLEKEGQLLMTDLITMDADGGGGLLATGLARYIQKTAGLSSPLVLAGDTAFADPDWRFVAVGPRTLHAQTPEMTKVSALSGDQLDVRVGPNGTLRVDHGSVLGLNESNAQCGMVPVDVMSAIEGTFGPQIRADLQTKLASDNGARVVFTPRAPQQSAPALNETDRSNLWRAAAMITPQLAKEAGLEAEKAKDTVDAVLGLNYLTDAKIEEFIQKVGVLQEAQQTLATLLMASRLGMEVDSGPIRSALVSLDRVISGLEELQSANNGA